MRIISALVMITMMAGCSNIPATKDAQNVADGELQDTAPAPTHKVTALLSATYMGADAPLSTCMKPGGTLKVTNNGSVLRNDENGSEIPYRDGEVEIALGSHYAIVANAGDDTNCKLDLNIHSDGKLVYGDENRHISVSSDQVASSGKFEHSGKYISLDEYNRKSAMFDEIRGITKAPDAAPVSK